MQTRLLKGRHHEEPISDELRSVLESIGTTRVIQQDSFVFHEGDVAHEIYIIKSGIVQMSKLAANGKELILRICKRDDIIGELTLFSDNPAFLLSARVLTSGEVLVINKERLERALLENSMLTLEFMKWTSNHMRKFQSKIRDLLLNGKKGALYSTLIRLVNSYGVEKEDGWLIEMAFTNQELANFCAATRESINRMLSDLRRKNIISMEPTGEILVKDMEYLRNEIGCENCPIDICNIN